MITFAQPKVPTHDELGKSDLIGALIVITLSEYDQSTQTKYGVTETIRADVLVVDGEHAGTREDRFFAAGNLARQIGEALDVGETAPGRIETGKSASGRDWFGISWCTDPVDVLAAQKAVEAREKPAGAAEKVEAPQKKPGFAAF